MILNYILGGISVLFALVVLGYGLKVVRDFHKKEDSISEESVQWN